MIADVVVFRASDDHLLFRVPVGPPPQHVAFDGTYAYLDQRVRQHDRAGRRRHRGLLEEVIHT
jgi:hypothetical protein